jgi:hypothetical protein
LNSDDMNDAEFDAFLKGEDALSRELQAMPQVGPSAELDAAILGRAQALMASESRPAAANDAANGMVSPLPRLGLRWRVPFGIAATLMAGVLAHQAWQASSDGNRAAEVIETAPAPATQSEPAPKAAIDTETVAPAPTPAKTAPPPRQKQLAPHRSAPELAKAPAETPSPEMPAAAPPPPPPPVISSYASAPAPAVSDMANAKSATVEVSGRRSRVVEARRSSEPEPLSTQAGAMAAAAPDPKVWLAAIDELLKAGLRRDTLEEWGKFRAAYPDYPVPAETTDKINALRK